MSFLMRSLTQSITRQIGVQLVNLVVNKIFERKTYGKHSYKYRRDSGKYKARS